MYTTNHGWTQRVACKCSEAPEHDKDCMGKFGLTILTGELGPSALERLWGGLDEAMELLMGGDSDPETKGMARGLALAIACIVNPAKPNWQAIRKEAVRRWKLRREVE